MTGSPILRKRWGDGWLTHSAGGDDGVLEHAAAQLATKLNWGLLRKHLWLLGSKKKRKRERERQSQYYAGHRCRSVSLLQSLYMINMWIGNRRLLTLTVSSSSSCREKVERSDMLDSECRERTEMAESERRGVLMGSCRERQFASKHFLKVI